MKIDRTRCKKSSCSNVSRVCQAFIDKIKGLTTADELYDELSQVKTWIYGESDIANWADVFDKLDDVLERLSCKANRWSLGYLENKKDQSLLLVVLRFSKLIIEHSSSRHIYDSFEHLTALLLFSDMKIVLSVLDFISVFSKRSGFVIHLATEKRQALIQQLLYLADTWNATEVGFGLATCCQDLSMDCYSSRPTTIIMDFCEDVAAVARSSSDTVTSQSRSQKQLYLQHIDRLSLKPEELFEKIFVEETIPAEKEMELVVRVRAASSFSNYAERLDMVRARLKALLIIVHANAAKKHLSTLLYSGFVEELVDLLQLSDDRLNEIRVTMLRILSSIVGLDQDPKLSNIIDATGARTRDGVLPVLMRNCIQHMTDPELTPFPHVLSTALLSVIYHLARHENGAEALVSGGVMESLLQVISWFLDNSQDHCKIVTKVVRIVDLITFLDKQDFQSLGGMATFINRLQHEVDLCRKEQPYVIHVKQDDSSMSESSHMSPDDRCQNEMDTSFSSTTDDLPSTSAEPQVTGKSLEDHPASAEPQVTGKSLEDHPASAEPQVTGKSLEDHPASAEPQVTGKSLEDHPASAEPQVTGKSLEDHPASAEPQVTGKSLEDHPASAEPQVTGKSLEDHPASAESQAIGKSLEGQPTGRGTCFPQRGALLKSMLDFLKKAITDTSFSDSIRHLMDGSLPRSLKHIISNAEYYGPSLFLLATELVTVYVFQEPSMLSTLQANGLTDVVLQALLVKDVPATKEVLSSLPNVFSALCLNNKGLEAFVACRPFDCLFKVLLSSDYLPAMSHTNASETLDEAMLRFGNVLDDVLKYQTNLMTVPADVIKKLVMAIQDVAIHLTWRTSQRKVQPGSETKPENGSDDEDLIMVPGKSQQQVVLKSAKRVSTQSQQHAKKPKVTASQQDSDADDFGEEPDLEILRKKKKIVLIDTDNWNSDLTNLIETSPSETMLWFFRGEKGCWKVPVKSSAYQKAKGQGNIFVNKKSGPSKDSADFDIVLTVGWYEDKLPKEIPFVILSGDEGFKQVELKYKKKKRTVVHISPHHLHNQKLSVLIDSAISL